MIIKHSEMSIRITNINLSDEVVLALESMSKPNGKQDIIKNDYLEYYVKNEDNYDKLIGILDLIETYVIDDGHVTLVGNIFNVNRDVNDRVGYIYTYKGNIYTVYHICNHSMEKYFNLYDVMTPGHKSLHCTSKITDELSILTILDFYLACIRKNELMILDEISYSKKLELLYDLEDPEVHRGFYKIENTDAYIIMTFTKKSWKVLEFDSEISKKETIRTKDEMIKYIDSDAWKIDERYGCNIDLKDDECEDVIARYNFMYRCKYILEYSDKKYRSINDMFNNDIEHPSNTQITNGLPVGTMWSYLADNYLNGLVNYINIFHGIMIRYYTPLEKENRDSRIVTWEKACSDVVTKFDCHTDLSEANQYDDILILGETLDSYWLLWRSVGGSSSIIGRIGKYQVKDKQELIEILHNSVPELTDSHKEYLVLPEFVGWITL